jgi:hypothetical protein
MSIHISFIDMFQYIYIIHVCIYINIHTYIWIPYVAQGFRFFIKTQKIIQDIDIFKYIYIHIYIYTLCKTRIPLSNLSKHNKSFKISKEVRQAELASHSISFLWWWWWWCFKQILQRVVLRNLFSIYVEHRDQAFNRY